MFFKFLFPYDMGEAGDGESLVKFSLAHAAFHVPLVNLKCSGFAGYFAETDKMQVEYLQRSKSPEKVSV